MLAPEPAFRDTGKVRTRLPPGRTELLELLHGMEDEIGELHADAERREAEQEEKSLKLQEPLDAYT